MARYRYRALRGGELLQGTARAPARPRSRAAFKKRGAMVLGRHPGGQRVRPAGTGAGRRRRAAARGTRGCHARTCQHAGRRAGPRPRFAADDRRSAEQRAAAVLGRVRDLVRNGTPLATRFATRAEKFSTPLYRPGPRRRGRGRSGQHAGASRRACWSASAA